MDNYFMQFMAAALIVFLLSVWALVRLSRNKTESTLHIHKQDLLLDSSLRDFRKRLLDAFKDDFDIYPCVRLADLLKVSYKAGDKSSEAFQQKVLSLSVDFVLIDQLNGKVMCLVQMDKELEKTDQYRFLERSCQQANLPIVHFSKDNTLDAAKIRKQILCVLEPTINLEDNDDNEEIRVYLEPVNKKADIKTNEYKVEHDSF